MIVMKFGGSSVESALAIGRVAEIVRSRLDCRPVVVVSAMGKTTNRLLEIAATAVAGSRERALELLHELRAFHLTESAGLGIGAEIEERFHELAELVRGLAIMGELTPRATDAISAYGERLSSVVVTALFRRQEIDAVHVDARNVIVTDRRHTNAAPLFVPTYEKLAAVVAPLAQQQVVVIGGFIGATEDGITTTLGRGGSDYTASIVGAGIGADEIQIWTDVDGLLTADPRIYSGGHRVRVCSFAEAAELAYFGAKVLHPSTVHPAIETNIPVRILNSRRPEVEGTLIVSDPPVSSTPVRSIACKREIHLVNIVSTRMLGAHGFLRRIFEVFERYETPVDMLATSEVSVSLTIEDPRHLPGILTELEMFAEATVEEDLAIICLVGENLKRSNNATARVFVALNGIKPRMVSQGASQLNISLVVPGADLTQAVELLHNEFFATPDPESFA